MKKALVIALIGMNLVFFNVEQAFACSCRLSTLAEQVQRTDLIVAATAAEDASSKPASGRRVIKLDVTKIYKGKPTEQAILVSTGAQESACGYGPIPAKERIWFAYKFSKNSGYSIESCTPARQPKAGKRIENLVGAAAITPAKATNQSETADSQQTWLPWLISGVSLVIGFGLLRLFQRKLS